MEALGVEVTQREMKDGLDSVKTTLESCSVFVSVQWTTEIYACFLLVGYRTGGYVVGRGPLLPED